MIFHYKYVHHPVESLNNWIEHLVLEVWCKARGPFDISKLESGFQLLVQDVNPKNLLQPITEIYEIFEILTDAEKQKLAEGYINNNALEEVCAGKLEPMTYKDVKVINEELAYKMENFFPNLYTELLGLAAFTNRCGVLKDYYNAFMQANGKGKCPFCGLNDLKSELLSKREAYDHYLPKATYPFNSVNFKNLLPTCNTCNSSYKGKLEIIVDKFKHRRKAFYPFSEQKPDVNFAVQVDSFYMDDPKKSNVTVSVSSTTQDEEVQGWMEVYGLQERYNDKCRSEDSMLWIEQMTDELKNHTDNFEYWFSVKIEQCNRRPYLEYNFLRVPFLLSCKKKKHFKALES